MYMYRFIAMMIVLVPIFIFCLYVLLHDYFLPRATKDEILRVSQEYEKKARQEHPELSKKEFEKKMKKIRKARKAAAFANMTILEDFTPEQQEKIRAAAASGTVSAKEILREIKEAEEEAMKQKIAGPPLPPWDANSPYGKAYMFEHHGKINDEVEKICREVEVNYKKVRGSDWIERMKKGSEVRSESKTPQMPRQYYIACTALDACCDSCKNPFTIEQVEYYTGWDEERDCMEALRNLSQNPYRRNPL